MPKQEKKRKKEDRLLCSSTILCWCSNDIFSLAPPFFAAALMAACSAALSSSFLPLYINPCFVAACALSTARAKIGCQLSWRSELRFTPLHFSSRSTYRAQKGTIQAPTSAAVPSVVAKELVLSKLHLRKSCFQPGSLDYLKKGVLEVSTLRFSGPRVQAPILGLLVWDGPS